MRKNSSVAGIKADKNLNLSSRFAALDACLGEPPLLEGEDRSAYETLSKQIQIAVEPRDEVEYLWVRDVIALTWEIQRLRRLKTSYLASSKPVGLKELLDPRISDYFERKELIHACTLGDEGAEEELDNILSASKLTREAIVAESFVAKIDDFEKFERMIALAEARRLTIIREVDRHREALARQLRDAVDAQDADYRVIDKENHEAIQ